MLATSLIGRTLALNPALRQLASERIDLTPDAPGCDSPYFVPGLMPVLKAVHKSDATPGPPSKIVKEAVQVRSERSERHGQPPEVKQANGDAQ